MGSGPHEFVLTEQLQRPHQRDDEAESLAHPRRVAADAAIGGVVGRALVEACRPGEDDPYALAGGALLLLWAVTEDAGSAGVVGEVQHVDGRRFVGPVGAEEADTSSRSMARSSSFRVEVAKLFSRE